jgi:hypothetical protein
MEDLLVNLSNNSSLLLQAVHYDILAEGFNMIDRILIPLMYIFFSEVQL